VEASLPIPTLKSQGIALQRVDAATPAELTAASTTIQPLGVGRMPSAHGNR